MASDEKPGRRILEMRDEVLTDMAEADLEFSRVRMQVERMESDMRIGRGEHPEYQETKGHLLPRAEARLVDLFRQLLKLEDKINTTPG